jgi:hypothetical protein
MGFGIYRRVYTAPKPRRTASSSSSSSPQWKPQILHGGFGLNFIFREVYTKDWLVVWVEIGVF